MGQMMPDISRVFAEATGATPLDVFDISESDRIGIKREMYNSYSAEYESRTGACIDLYAPDYDLFRTRMVGTRVLDLGCGPGRDARQLERRGLHVLGVDLAAYALRRCGTIETRCLNYETDLSTLAGLGLDGLWTNCSLTTTPRERIKQILLELSFILPVGAPAFFGFIAGDATREGWIAPNWKYALPRYRFRDNQEGIEGLLSVHGFEPVHTRIIPRAANGKNTYINVHCTNVRYERLRLREGW